MKPPSMRERWRYRADEFMARGGKSIFILLVVIFLFALLVIAALRGVTAITLSDGQVERGDGLPKQVYITWLELTDPGSMTQDVESSGWIKMFAILSGLIGIVLLSSLIAFITTALDRRLSELKKGHSRVVATGHTLILGWNERVVDIIRELVIANESEDQASVVILADHDKEAMDDHLALHIPDTRTTDIVTRSGTESSLVDLGVVSVESCKSVLVLARCNMGAGEAEVETSDIAVLKTILGLVAARPDQQRLSIVAEIFTEENREIATDISPGEVTTVDAHEILAKMLVQTSRSVGLATVYSTMLSFDGPELYLFSGPWTASSFGGMALCFADGVPLGIRQSNGEMLLNPPATAVVEAGDELVVLAEDDSTIAYSDEPVAEPTAHVLPSERIERRVEKELLIGWTAEAETVLREYDDYVLPGSHVDIMVHSMDGGADDAVAQLNDELDSLQVELIEADPRTMSGLRLVEPASYDNIIILSQVAENASEERTDSETIIILLVLRKLLRENGASHGRPKLITEILDSENQPLVTEAGVYDFIISNQFISMLLAQLSEDRRISEVYDDLFQEDGSEIYLKPAEHYLSDLPADVTFTDLIGLAQQRSEVALGVKLADGEHDATRNFGVELVPPKDRPLRLTSGDTVVVLAEDET